MIYSLNGTLLEKDIGMAVIECSGVGYHVSVTNRCLSLLPNVGQATQIWTYMNMREDSVELFGFADKEERDCFKMLLGVSGVGPKMALSILSEVSPSDFATSVASGDHVRLTAAQGVGPKLAQRVVLELKDKVKKLYGEIPVASAAKEIGYGEKSLEVINALMVLGYTQHEAKRAVSKIDIETLDVQAAIKEALKQLM